MRRLMSLALMLFLALAFRAACSAQAAHFDPLSIAILPPVDVPGFVAELQGLGRTFGFPVKVLTPEEVVDPHVFAPGRFSLAVQVGFERYLQTVKEPGDAERAMQGFLDAGGMLIVAPHTYPLFRPLKWLSGTNFEGENAEPYNFHGYLRIAPQGEGSFETPPEEVEFVRQPDQTGRFSDLPARLPFAGASDKRFRPLLLKDLHCTRFPLYDLVGSSGRDYGAGAALLELPAEHFPHPALAYICFQLLESPGAHDLAVHLLAWRAGQLSSRTDLFVQGEIQRQISTARSKQEKLAQAASQSGVSYLSKEALAAKHLLTQADEAATLLRIEPARNLLQAADNELKLLQQRLDLLQDN